jgi:hypothetical protein
MKYHRILFISVPVGILLSSLAVSAEGGTPYDTGKVHSAMLPGFVKPNEGLERVKDHPATDAWIFAQLYESTNNNQWYIRYCITDQNGVPGEWHDSTTTNETPAGSSGATIFTTLMDFHKDISIDAIVNPATGNKEVEISGVDTSGKRVRWISDCSKYTGTNANDTDVSWSPYP